MQNCKSIFCALHCVLFEQSLQFDSPQSIAMSHQWSLCSMFLTCYRIAAAGCRLVLCSAPSVLQPVFTITAPTRAFSWLKAPTSAFTFKCESTSRRFQPQEKAFSVIVKTSCGTDGAIQDWIAAAGCRRREREERSVIVFKASHLVYDRSGCDVNCSDRKGNCCQK